MLKRTLDLGEDRWSLEKEELSSTTNILAGEGLLLGILMIRTLN